ncbi:hypothetical protein SNE40_019569 [Patella caerulea]|uniref:ABC transporter domain-containing protein n=1 Tax=Patella caerulea TaxID=87958 RepID=A0AAN8JAR9_PATCE
MVSFFQQLKALMQRNILLKKRNKKQLIQEIFFPIYFVAILAMIKALSKPSTKPAINRFPVNSLNDSTFQFNATTKKILVSPNTTDIQTIMTHVSSLLGSVQYEMYGDMKTIEDIYRNNSKEIGAGLVFNYQGGNIMDYAIRMDYSDASTDGKWLALSTAGCRDSYQLNGTMGGSQCQVNNFLTSGFIWLQNAIDTALIRVNKSNPSVLMPDVSVQLMPKGPFTSDISIIQTLASIYFVFAYSLFINFLTTNIVAEKEKKIREGMKMMGLKDVVFWLSWSLIYAALILLVTIIVIIIAYASNFLPNSNIFLLFLMLFLYGLSIINLAFLLTPFFKKAKVAGIVAGFSTVIISCLYFAVSLTRTQTVDGYSYSVGAGGRVALCFLSPVALALAVDQGLFLDVAKGGMTFETATLGEFPLYIPILMLCVDFILYGLLAFYLDHVIPGEYGVRYKPWYCLLPSYWCQSKKGNYDIQSLIDNQHLTHHSDMTHGDDVENVPREMEEKASIRLYNIGKTFPGKEKGETINAVNGISLDIYEGQITGLLGHNGAGKTTLLNMLYGLLPTTSGGAIINNLDVSDSSDMEKIRSMCGICPQHNILYDELSCKEHLRVFAGIKGVHSGKVESVIKQSLTDVDLSDQGDVFAKDLSGGQKRKLSVAIALIGDPKIIFLDEPTAGMDPHSRRHLWSLLKKQKAGKVIVLTTHFMDEADILADRKAIISKGKLRCCGSSLFLKSKFGIGYHLNMISEPSCNADDVTELLKENINGVEHRRSHGKELAYTVPLNEVDKFAAMFNSLEEKGSDGVTKAEKMGIKSYGVSMTSLEEVFLKLGNDEESDDTDGKSANGTNMINVNDVSVNMDRNSTPEDANNLFNSKNSLNLNKGGELMKQRLKAFLKIRFLLQIREKLALIFQIFLPIILVTSGLLLNKFGAKVNTSNDVISMSIKPDQYASSNFLFVDSMNDATSQAVVTQLNTYMKVDDIKNTSVDLMSIAPHNIGVNLQTMVTGTSMVYTSLYNDTALLSLPVIVNIMSNILLGDNLINTFNLPWPSLTNKRPYDGTTFSSIMILGMAFVFTIAGFAANHVKIKEIKFKSQLRVSGITFNMYWGVNFLFDLGLYLIPAIVCIIIVLAIQLPSLTPGGAIFCVIVLFITFIPANILLAYCFTYAFDKFETCIAVLPNVFLYGSLIPYLAVSLMDMLIREGNAPVIVHYLCTLLIPPYSIFGGFYYIDRVYRIKSYMQQTDSILFSDYMEAPILLPLLIPICHAVLLYILLRILDIKSNGGDIKELFKSSSHSNQVVPDDNSDLIKDEDEDVKEERQTVANLQHQSGHDYVAFVSNLRKEFTKRGKTEYKGCTKVEQDDKIKVAVRNATMSVKAGEVFGLLGPNGAGKTTLMNMIIAEVGPTRGKVVVNGHDIRSNMSDAFQALGYCPQHDPLLEAITLKEHLQLFAAIRGVPESQIDRIANFYIENLKVQEHADKHTKKCSGGTKRKLCYAISMLGSPEVVLLDEPSTGMDPQSKRFLWDTISASFSSTEKGAILTTHYMEEADALCNRLAIMVNGKLECLGPSQHLKDKYGSGYLLEIKIKQVANVEEKMDELEEEIKRMFPHYTCAERFGDRGQYKIPREDVTSLAQAFASLENAKQNMGVEEYSFCQSTLEQVFLEFAKKQFEEGDENGVIRSPKRKASSKVL